MKKLLILGAAVLAFQATPALAEHHEGGKGHKEKMVSVKDTNGDGVVSKAEFLAHAEKKFATMDVNNDGSISKEEGREAKKSKREEMKEKRKERKEKRKENADK